MRERERERENKTEGATNLISQVMTACFQDKQKCQVHG
jgi:hypothetical protein